MKLINKSAFTLIEMVISISMIAIVTALFIANYRSANKRTDLIMTAQSLVADLHLAQNNTLGLVKYNTAVPAGGWGIAFDVTKNYYILFADLDAPGDPGHMSMEEAEEALAEYGGRVTHLPADITIAKLTTTGEVDNDAVNVIFLPPNPQTNIYRAAAAATSSSLEIELREGRNNSIKTVRINFLGLVEVLD
ncbi:MAG: type II secretion system protein [Candidatus Falkowbacteria bacterium]|nr:type II secretion system protein [Candidatus Falkowbacteria bacterium]